MSLLSFEKRQEIRVARDAHIRAERADVFAMSIGNGRCSWCRCPHDEYTPGCVTCRDRERLRGKRAAGLIR